MSFPPKSYTLVIILDAFMLWQWTVYSCCWHSILYNFQNSCDLFMDHHVHSARAAGPVWFYYLFYAFVHCRSLMGKYWKGKFAAQGFQCVFVQLKIWAASSGTFYTSSLSAKWRTESRPGLHMTYEEVIIVSISSFPFSCLYLGIVTLDCDLLPCISLRMST